MSSAVKNGEKEKEVTPEALLERLKKAESSDDPSVDFRKLFDDLSQLILHIINKSHANADTKARANLYMGLLTGWFHELLDAYEVNREFGIGFERDMYDEMKNALEKLIDAYAYLKKRGSLEKAIGIIFDAQLWAEDTIKDHLDRIAEMSEDLQPRPYW